MENSGYFHDVPPQGDGMLSINFADMEGPQVGFYEARDAEEDAYIATVDSLYHTLVAGVTATGPIPSSAPLKDQFETIHEDFLYQYQIDSAVPFDEKTRWALSNF